MTSSNTRPEDLDLFRGDLVRLDAFDLERDVAEFAAWHADPKFQRLGFDQPIRPLSTDEARALMERWRDDWPGSLSFAVHALDDDRLVGLTRLYDIEPNHRTAILGISIASASGGGRSPAKTQTTTPVTAAPTLPPTTLAPATTVPAPPAGHDHGDGGGGKGDGGGKGGDGG